MMKNTQDVLETQKEAAEITVRSQMGVLRLVEAVVSHTLTEVLALLQGIMREAKLPPPLFDHLYRTELRCRSTLGKINAVVELYGGEDAIGEIRSACYDTVKFFTVVANQINNALGHKMKGEVRFIPEEDSETTVVFDARRVCMILYHLVSNAIQHGATENKNVEIRAVVKNHKLELSVRDHGGGISKEKIPTLFLGYAQALTLQNLKEGPFPPQIHGIGLPLCKKLSEDMKGELLFKNYKTGVKFTLLLPQPENRFYEPAVYFPDDTLLKECMAELLSEIYENL